MEMRKLLRLWRSFLLPVAAIVELLLLGLCWLLAIISPRISHAVMRHTNGYLPAFGWYIGHEDGGA